VNGRSAAIGWLHRLVPLLQAVVVLSIWLISRFYRGIVQDSRIYIGRAMADLDPQGLGRELTFQYDEQTQHTIFSHLILPMVQAFGPSTTSIAVTLAALLIWLAAAAWLASRLMPRRMVPAALICAALLPAVYGPFDIFSFGEAMATPRGFAEAGVMAGLAALLGGRRLLCVALLVMAALFHPIMAAPGFGVMVVVFAEKDRRWWWAPLIGLVGLLAAGALHLGAAKALFSVYDPAWLQVMHRKNHLLFLMDWPLTDRFAAATAPVTLALAAMVLRGRPRAVVVAALIVASAGLAASFVLGDLFDNVLTVQLQLWRALWIVQVLAVLLVPCIATELWTTGRRDARLSVILLGLSWVELNGSPFSLLALAAALVCAIAALRDGADRVSSKALVAVSIGAFAYIVAATGVGSCAAVALIRTYAAQHVALPFHFLLALNLHLAPILAIALTPLLFPNWIKPTGGAIVLAVSALTLAPLTTATWDQRPPTRRMIDTGEGRADLNRLIGPSIGTGIAWMPDDVAPWFLLSRPAWLSDLQGTVGTFSRPLIMAWDQRTAELIASGLGPIRNGAAPASTPSDRARDDAQTRDGALRLCQVKTGPEAIVLAGDLAKLFPPGVAGTWRAPVTDVSLSPGPSVLQVAPFDLYTVVRCRDIRREPPDAHRASLHGL